MRLKNEKNYFSKHYNEFPVKGVRLDDTFVPKDNILSQNHEVEYKESIKKNVSREVGKIQCYAN